MPVDANLAQMSNLLLYSAMFVYAVAFGAFVTALASRAARLDADLEQPSAVVAATQVREKVAVGAGVGGGSSLTHDTPEATTADSAPLDADASTKSLRRASKATGIALSLTWLALALHIAAVVARAASVHRLPWGNMFEFAMTGSVVVTAVFLGVVLRRDVRYLGAFVIGPVLLTLGLAITVFYTEAAQLVPALRSVWLGIHVSIAFIASALYTLAFSTTVLQLVQERRELALAAGKPWTRGTFMQALPSSRELERSSFRLHVAAFPLWGFTLIAGAIWAESAWGRYWNWDPKETWTFIIWVVYAAHLHARATRGWQGRRSAYIALAGYACLLANFLLVNFFAVGKHTYKS